ncbi:acetyl-coenzyme A synthetase [Kytococcus aerolatus]|uniref:Acetyl-coenzyme A synthetase n=1 Tax=Kytococcus aerolatus TaxID=592308 RepID=A0A212TFX1_9MICO|nr:acetate--CoA ligase [Kytococcus aerolatus]SNC64922.1 acetyl-coenzyme A synthetase [Kytococcus aerolatus]
MAQDTQHAPEPAASYPPPAEFATAANGTADLYQEAAQDRESFWAEQARRLPWHTDFEEVLDWSEAPFARWFADGELNASYVCLDQHVEAGRGEEVAIHWVGEPEGDRLDLTWNDLLDRTRRAANVLLELGVRAGDRVAIYLPMIPEAVVAMLACARIGATHSVVFGGFAPSALRTRIDDAEAKVVITADGGYRKGKASALKPNVDAALEDGGSPVSKVLVVRRTGQEVDWVEGRDLWWHEQLAEASREHEAEPMPAEQPLFILYTSGTTGKPKGIFHTTGGYLTQAAYTARTVLDLKPGQDVHWCTADVGWVTGHTYIVYGPMALGVTQVLYEGTPDTPHKGRWWEIVEQFGVTVLYTAPTAIRAAMKWGDDIPAGYDLSSIRLLGSVGEPINPEAWTWYRNHIGAGTAPVVDTWWQTETGAMMIAPLPGVTELVPGSAQVPVPGIEVDVVDDAGRSVADGEGGYLVVREPWPAMLRGVWGDPQRFRDTYWSRFEGMYFAGDGAKRDEDGNVWVLGRVDDVMNVSGHRLSTAEIESALVGHDAVAEAAVVGASDPGTGQAVVAYVILRGEVAQERADRGAEDAELVEELRQHVSREIGPIARPRDITIVPELPKTRSGKIMRRLLRDVAEGNEVGDVSTLADPTVMDHIRR